MKLISTHLLNFRLHADTFIEFTGGMTGIIGDNESGKSTITEAIRWAFFGAKALRKTVKTLRWMMAPAKHLAQVDLVFEIGGERYTVERTEKKAKLYVLQSGPAGAPSEKSYKPIAEGIDAVDEFLPKLIGMDLQEFDATYMCGQKDIGRLVNMKGTARKQFILKIMGVGRIDEGLKACREKKNALASEAEGMEAGLGEKPTAAVVTAKEELRVAEEAAKAADSVHAAAGLVSEKADEAFKKIDHQREEHNQLVADLKHRDEVISRLNDQIRASEKELTEAKKAQQEAADLTPQLLVLPELMDQRRDLEKTQTQQQERQRVLGELDELRQRRSPIEAEIEELDEVITGTETVEVGVLKEAMDSLEEDHHKSGAMLAALRVELKKAEKSHSDLDGLGEEGVCPTCNRELGNAYDYVMKNISEHITKLERAIEDGTNLNDADQQAWLDSKKAFEDADAILKEFDQAVRKQVELRKQRDQMKVDINAKQKTLADLEVVKFDQGDFDLLIEKIDELDKMVLRKTALDAKAGRIPEIGGSLDGLTNNRDGHRDERQKQKLVLRGLEFDANEWAKAKTNADECEGVLNSALQEQSAARASCVACQKSVTNAEAAMAEYEERSGQLAVLKINLGNHEKAAVRLAEFRTAMAGSIRPDLEELTSGFVQILTDGRHEGVILSEDFEVTLLEGGIPTEVISGGTEDIVALAQRLSISQMIAQRAGHPLSLLMLDEPFGSLDDVRRGNVLALLDSLKGTFEQTLVSTHVDEVKNSVDSLITCQYDPSTQSATITQEEGAA